MRPLQELVGGGRVADRGRLVDVEHYGEVQRVGPVGEGFFELPVDAQPFQGGRQWRELRDRSPEEWADAVAFDRAIRHGHPGAIHKAALRGRAFLHRSLRPLDQVDLTPPTASTSTGSATTARGRAAHDPPA